MAILLQYPGKTPIFAPTFRSVSELTNQIRTMNNKLLAWAAFIAAVVLAFTGLLTPPRGEIDSSVSMVVAQFLLLCATLLGIKSYADYLFIKPQNKEK